MRALLDRTSVDQDQDVVVGAQRGVASHRQRALKVFLGAHEEHAGRAIEDLDQRAAAVGWMSLSVRTTMIAGASNRDSDFLEAVVTLMRSRSSRLSVAKSIGGGSGGWASGRGGARLARTSRPDRSATGAAGGIHCHRWPLSARRESPAVQYRTPPDLPVDVADLNSARLPLLLRLRLRRRSGKLDATLRGHDVEEVVRFLKPVSDRRLNLVAVRDVDDVPYSGRRWALNASHQVPQI